MSQVHLTYSDVEALWKAFIGENPYKPLQKKFKVKNQKLPEGKTQKDLVFEAYGGYVCRCCGETEKAFLCVDHINEDGAAHRKVVKRNMYNWLKRAGFPAGFQILCVNCNWGKYRNKGQCPHQSALATVFRQ